MSASCSSRVRFEVRITYGPLLRADRPELGHRDLEVREHLEQERLELLVGAVDLVDQEHAPARRPRSPRAAGAGSGTRGRRAPPRRPSPPARRGCAAAAARSSTRRRRARRRGPRSTAGGSAARRARRRSPSRPRSCRRPPRPRAAAASRASARGRARSRARGRGGTTPGERRLELVDRGERHARSVAATTLTRVADARA